ncbi:hypothetical protein DFH07DRAFT_769759 [Mycena maculata]|uniref:Uncharacterized protein n=1 Tax=Mycena maculata TaxID=230809 RepID=A0AAD7JLF4_9AGAR|nr:hypothetical protein DFH07DRAFT_769759 [Mycena maculata]
MPFHSQHMPTSSVSWGAASPLFSAVRETERAVGLPVNSPAADILRAMGAGTTLLFQSRSKSRFTHTDWYSRRAHASPTITFLISTQWAPAASGITQWAQRRALRGVRGCLPRPKKASHSGPPRRAEAPCSGPSSEHQGGPRGSPLRKIWTKKHVFN